MEHVFTESMFLVGFVIFIAAILVLDMLVIDRKAHVVSIKEAGSWTAVWIILALAFAVFIYFHGDMVHGIENDIAMSFSIPSPAPTRELSLLPTVRASRPF
jgi:tellurite resistance protein TerC